MKGRKGNTLRMLLCMVAVGVFLVLTPADARAATPSSYVSYTSDGFAWTVKEHIANAPLFYKVKDNRPAYWYTKGEQVATGITSTMRALRRGEHYYIAERTGEVPIGYWEVSHSEGKCIHGCTVSNWHGVPNLGPKGDGGNCARAYYSGWTAYCADCGGVLNTSIVYMSKTAARTITSVNTDKGYYYTCPSCKHIENTMGPVPHACKDISFNRYRVVYDKNVTDPLEVAGLMDDSYHMYNNEDVYEGEKITPNTRLSKNVYSRTGYTFTGWNTKKDGTGTSYADCSPILNLSLKNYDDDNRGGTVTLYAQWKRTKSTLKIKLNGGTYNDPALESKGGTYNSETGVVKVKKNYGESYHAKTSYVNPPSGWKVKFDVNGGERISAITQQQSFAGWTQKQPFAGKLKDNKYAFMGADGSTDVIEATYKNKSITLPEARKEDYSFGGWYSDDECTNLVGFAGDKYTATEDITLHAKWVVLVLSSEANYTDNGGKGAADLTWSQPDRRNKTYKVYMAKGNGAFSHISGAGDEMEEKTVSKTYSYKSSYEEDYEKSTYTIPYSGFYELSASGAQGGSYGSKSGGKGGKVTAKFYLSAGEKLTIALGGKGKTAGENDAEGGKGAYGYNGGKATKYGSGGGATTITSDQQGLLLVAGGGGGASPAGSGGKGGSTQSNRADRSNGEPGQAGGGAGYLGGKKGTVKYHSHDKDECGFHEHKKSTCYTSHTHGTSCYTDYIIRTRSDDKVTDACGCSHQTHYWKCTKCGGTNSSQTNSSQYCTQGHTVADVGAPLACHNKVKTCTLDEDEDILTCDTEEGYHCNKTTDDMEDSSNIAYGGSNYVSNIAVNVEANQAGKQTGNGRATIQSETIGFVTERSLKGVPAPDENGPAGVSTDNTKLSLKAEGQNDVVVTFRRPDDKASIYKFKVESYEKGSEELLCVSNKTQETIKTGVAGYYYILNTTPEKTVTASNANNKDALLPTAGTTETLTVQLTRNVMYLHIAAVDKAGNVGTTAHIPLRREQIPGGVSTGQTTVTDNINGRDYESVHLKTGKTYYVRADGETPFMLSFPSYLDGMATPNYQIDYQIFDVTMSSQHQQYSTRLPISNPIPAQEELRVADFIREMTGNSILQDAMNTSATRKQNGKENAFSQAFTLPGTYHGKTLSVIPMAGVTNNIEGTVGYGEVVLSDQSDDATHGVTLIADGVGPVINGMDVLENPGISILNISATDELSGVKEFYVEVTNTDNSISKVYVPERGIITLEITEDETVFNGDFMVTAYAVDNVGNETRVSGGLTEFALIAVIERILAPHEPLFKRGESGILSITVKGYADKLEVEFPQAFVQQNPELNQTWLYTEPLQYKREEALRFMVPLEALAEEEYKVTVRAYKNGRVLEECPQLYVVSTESVTEELRTRLR